MYTKIVFLCRSNSSALETKDTAIYIYFFKAVDTFRYNFKKDLYVCNISRGHGY